MFHDVEAPARALFLVCQPHMAQIVRCAIGPIRVARLYAIGRFF